MREITNKKKSVIKILNVRKENAKKIVTVKRTHIPGGNSQNISLANAATTFETTTKKVESKYYWENMKCSRLLKMINLGTLKHTKKETDRARPMVNESAENHHANHFNKLLFSLLIILVVGLVIYIVFG